MAYSPSQWKAIDNYLFKHRNLRPELSAYPVLRFSDKVTGEITEEHIQTLEDWYSGQRKEDQRERAKQKRLEKKIAKDTLK